VFGVAVELHLLAAIELGHRVEQAQHAGVNQVVQVDVHRKVFVDADGDRFHQRKMFEHDLIANLAAKSCAL
jgi:hypothetical protein